MFGQLQAARLFNAPLALAARYSTRRKLALLDQTARSAVEERKAQEVETELFFNPQLLAAAQARRPATLRLPRGILAACLIGTLILGTTPAHAWQADNVDSTAETVRNGEDEESIWARIKQLILNVLPPPREETEDPDIGND